MDLYERRLRVSGKNTLLFYDRPLTPVRGEDVWIYDADGRKYLDVYNNVPNVGHCHPRVVEALCRQASTLNIHTRYLHEEMIRYAERLTATYDEPLSRLVMTCTGTESNELAIRAARHLSGNKGLIVSDFAYHGNSQSLAEATTGLPAPEALAPHVRAVRIPDLTLATQDEGTVLAAAVEQVTRAIRELDEEGYGVAALLVDTLFSTEGLPLLPSGYVEQVVAAVRKAGGFYIADEVQPGFGRTGLDLWGYRLHGVTPDFVTMGKPMGNGHPVAGMATTADILDRFATDALYFNTFGGNPVSAAVANAVLDVIEEESLVENARVQGLHVREGLQQLMSRHEMIASVRGTGLFFGLEIVKDRDGNVPDADRTKRIVNLMRENGVLISRIGRDDNILKMRPPLTFRREHVDLLIATLDDVLTQVGHA